MILKEYYSLDLIVWWQGNQKVKSVNEISEIFLKDVRFDHF